MGWFSVLLAAAAAFLLFRTGHTFLSVIASIIAVGCFWSWGVMHNYATELAKRRSNHSGGFYDITDREAQGVPNWLAGVNMLFSLLGFILLLFGIAFMVWK